MKTTKKAQIAPSNKHLRPVVVNLLFSS